MARIPAALRRIDYPEPVIHPDGRLTIALPIPTQQVSANAQRGHSKAAAIRKGKAVKAHKQLAELTLKNVFQHIGKREFGSYSLAHFFQYDHWHRDDDNADGGCKAYRDGLALAMGIDDRGFRKSALSTSATDATCPRVEITLYPKLS